MFSWINFYNELVNNEGKYTSMLKSLEQYSHFIFRNPTTRKESSISPNFHPHPSATDNLYSHGLNGPRSSNSSAPPNRTISCAFNADSHGQTRQNGQGTGTHGGNAVHRSQSLSAAEFLKRHGGPGSSMDQEPVVSFYYLMEF